MKNLYVLSTDKISRLFLNEINNKLLIDDDNSLKKVLQSGSYQHIYITNDEKVKEGDWCIDLDSYFVTKFATCWKHKIVKKIILTINQELIYDGVQAIDNEFLEWFVKNPSCEEVMLWRFHGINTSIAEVNAISGDGSLNWQGRSDLRDYKIIIPRTNQQIIDEDYAGGLEMGQILEKEEPKQETLEEVAYKIFSTMPSEISTSTAKYKALELAKWQQEKMYSEEDLKYAYEQGKLYSNICYSREFDNVIEIIKTNKI
jgi:hypothetical protein